jgi:hypothetical protein
MTIWPNSGRQVTIPDAALRGTELRFYDADSQNILPVYKDAAFSLPHSNPIRVDSWGRFPNVFVKPTGRTYRAAYTYPDGNTVEYGPFDSGTEAGAATGYSAPSLPQSTKTGASITLVAADFGKTIEIAASSGETPVQLPRSNTVETGAIIAIRNTHGGGVLKVRAEGIELIDGRGTVPIIGKYVTKVFAVASSGYITVAESGIPQRNWSVKSRSSNDPPASSAAGETYLAPVGANIPWAADSIYVADGDGDWISYVPEVGWMCLVEDETDSTQVARSGNTASGSAEVTVNDASGLYKGMAVSGDGIPGGTTILSIAGATVTLSANATATASGVVVTFGSGTASIPRMLIYTPTGWVNLWGFFQDALAEAANAIA